VGKRDGTDYIVSAKHTMSTFKAGAVQDQDEPHQGDDGAAGVLIPAG
jgi:hypothetical protein